MNAQEHKEYTLALKEYAKEILSSKESSLALLIKAGIVDEQENLTEEYIVPNKASCNCAT